jgi:N6-adenosine-specific RNA methylase IME4
MSDAVIGIDSRAAEANQAYGELRAHLHDAGYTFERAMQRLEKLIAADAWMRISPGFTDINVFLRSLDFDQFRMIAEQRKRIASRIKELRPEASNRAIAKAFDVDEGTIRTDLRNDSARGREKPTENAASAGASAEKIRTVLSGAQAARRVIDFEEAPAKRAERRAERLSRIIDKNPPLPFGRRWSVLYGDPPWRWEAWSRETGLDHAPEAHYDTMAIEEIIALDVGSIAAEDAVLFLWATAPILPQALDLMSAWSFAYKTHLIWAKNRAGTGYWARNKHELLLIGTRGAIPAPLPGQQGDSIIDAEVEHHSEKPAVFADLIERWFPDVPKIELFRRGPPRLGWAAWGNEATREGECG